MIENYNVFKGIKQVFESTYTALTNSQKEGYLWFVRKDSAATVGDIHFGTKQYSEVDTPIPNATIDAIWDDVMNPVTLISFTINDISYQAESGMTWSEWVSSEYNTNGWFISGNEIRLSEGGGYGVIQNGATPDSTIKNNFAYVAKHHGGSSD